MSNPISQEKKSPVQCSIPDMEACITKIYTDEEIAKEQNEYSNNVVTLKKYQIAHGKVVRVSRRNVIVDIGYKSDGIIPFSEVRYMDSIKPGDSITVYVEAKEDKQGRLAISHRKALLVKAWEKIVDSMENSTIVEGIVEYTTKGGVVVNIDGIKCFLPVTQIDYRPVTDLESYVGKMIDLIVLKINAKNNNVVVSHKAIVEKDLASQREAIVESLERGAILEGVVKNISSFGAFVDLGGVDGLLHITDICWRRITSVEQELSLNQKVTVIILDLKDDNKHISLGMKQLTPHPWNTIAADFGIGKKVKGKVVCTQDYGIFVEVMPGVEGLVHASEISWRHASIKPKNYYKIGDEVEAIVIVFDKDEKKLALSIKQCTPNPWVDENFEKKYKIGDVKKGKIINITLFGAFVELEPGIDGLLHKYDLSWTSKGDTELNAMHAEDDIDVKILSYDKTTKKMSLSIKHLTKNPLEENKNSLSIGSIIKGVIIKFKQNKSAIVKLDIGIEVFVTKEELTQEDGNLPKIGDTLDFKVLDMNIEKNIISISHRATYSKILSISEINTDID